VNAGSPYKKDSSVFLDATDLAVGQPERLAK
jgi:hypothetical protein